MPSTRTILLLTACFIGLALPAIVRFVLLYVVTPLKGLGKRWVPAQATAVDVPLDTLPAATRQTIEQCTERFAVAGYERAAIIRYEGLDGDAVEVMFEDAASGDIGALIAIMGAVGQNHTLVLRSYLPNDEEITTAGWQAVSVLPRDPKAHSIRCGWVRDPAVLVELHRRRVAKSPTRSIGRLPYPPGGRMAWLDEQFVRSSRRFGDTGYARLDPASGWYVRTLRGTCFAVWKLLWPWRNWRTARADREARQVWRDLDMDRYTPPPDPIATAAVAAPAAGASLDYNVRLAPGTMTQEWRGPVLIVRAGNPTAGQVLMRQWLNVLSLLFFALLLILNLTIWYQVPGGSGFRMSGMFYVVVFILGWDVWLLIRALRKVRGTTTVTVSPAGIDFQNAPGRPRDGRLNREDISNLLAHVADEQSVRRKRAALTAATHGSVAVCLLEGGDAETMEQVRLAVRRALQLDPEPSMSQN